MKRLMVGDKEGGSLSEGGGGEVQSIDTKKRRLKNKYDLAQLVSRINILL